MYNVFTCDGLRWNTLIKDGGAVGNEMVISEKVVLLVFEYFETSL